MSDDPEHPQSPSRTPIRRYKDANTNWYLELLELKNVEGIACGGQLYKDVASAREKLDYDFDSGYGCEYGPCFTCWTKDRVYFPVKYDGSEWISSVPRHPCDEVTGHQGGG